LNQFPRTSTTDSEPRWVWRQHFPRAGYHLPHWILDETSLTDRLINASDNHFAVVRRRQAWLQPLPSERQLLGLGTRRRALVREVQLECGGVPWVFARSVIPAATCTGALRHLRGLQNRSLGSLLFNRPNLIRSDFQLATIALDSDYVPADLPRGEKCWARRSKFSIDRKDIMVSEVFLPAFQPWASSMLQKLTAQSKL
jgi:chorismate--pyruvate lyase